MYPLELLRRNLGIHCENKLDVLEGKLKTITAETGRSESGYSPEEAMEEALHMIQIPER